MSEGNFNHPTGGGSFDQIQKKLNPEVKMEHFGKVILGTGPEFCPIKLL